MNRAARGDLQLFGGTAPEDRALRIRNEKSPSRLQPDPEIPADRRGSIDCKAEIFLDCRQSARNPESKR